MKRIISIVTLLCFLFVLSSCTGKQSSRPKEYDGVQSVDALLDYARRLEENGDYDAAAVLYEVIAKAAAGSAELPPAGETVAEYRDAQEVFSSLGH